MMTMSNYKFYLLLGVMSNLTFAISDNPADAILAVVFAVAAVAVRGIACCGGRGGSADPPDLLL